LTWTVYAVVSEDTRSSLTPWVILFICVSSGLSTRKS